MLTVHHLAGSRSLRIVWLLEELGVPYRLERYARDATFRAPPEYRALHPVGKSPLLADGDLVLAESGAIVEYLLETHGGGRLAPPPCDPLRARYLFWLHFAEGTAMAFLVTGIILGLAGDGAAPLREAFAAEVQRLLAYTEQELGDGPWLLGEAFTAADVMMGYAVATAEARGDLAEHERLRAYVTRLRERPAHARARAAAGE